MPREDSWTAEWIKGKYEDDGSVNIEVEGENLLAVTYNNGPRKLFATMSLSSVDVEDIDQLLDITGEVHGIVNTQSKPRITKELIDYSNSRGIPIGGMADFYNLITTDLSRFASYVNKDISFIYRGLNQHDKVIEVERLDRDRFLVHRADSLNDCVIYNSDEYDVTADVIRQILAENVEFDAILLSNPNHRLTSEGSQVIRSQSLKVFKWGELLGALNRRRL